ncbi:MAG: hypothetical protein H6838_07600 [Planctomycetes bacterium]|nr:hypothetical protein [Planctomycetota bacterium]
MNRIVHSTLAVAVAALASAPLLAQSIPDRATLLGILGPNSTHEGFEGFVTGTAITSYNGLTLDYESVLGSFSGWQGPGLVEFGARYLVTSGGLAWFPPGYGPSGNSIGRAFQTGGTIRIDYPVPVSAMGVDVWALVIQPVTGTATFKDAAGAVLGTVPIAISSAATPTAFVGWQSGAGIARVEIAMSTNAVFASIDNHDYALDQTLVAHRTRYGQGCGTELASIAEDFLQNQNPFDLSNQSLRFTNTGAGFLVTRGTAPIVPPTAPPLSGFNNSTVIPCPLGWSFPYPGGSTSTLYLSPRGFVHLVPNTDPYLTSFFNSGPVIAGKAGYLYPAQGGTLTFESDPVAGTATVTFDQVMEWPNPFTSTFQFYFDATGTMELRYGACSPADGTVGWSPGMGSSNPGNTDLSQLSTRLLPAADVPALGMLSASRPILGQTIHLSLEGLRTGSILAAHVYGLSRLTPAIDLTPIGMPGCFQYCSLDAIEPTVSPTNPVVRPFTIPNDPNLAGVLIQVQGLSFHPGNVTPNGVVTSNGLELLLNAL